ncbi:MAG: FRG domain-containing protein [Ignavibacteria bacterium]|jgi:hypothetical protein
MGRPLRWQEDKTIKGVMEVKISSWKYFSDYINQEMLDYTTYIYRGHGDSKWKLEPTLDRIIKLPNSSKRRRHLEAFKYAARGRRGFNPPKLENENDWWALGQHHGLATPLLDWTKSPFVALFFAASTALNEESDSFSVFALSEDTINENNKKIKEDDKVKLVNSRKPTVRIVKPLTDENNRLVNQSGLFTRGPNNIDIEKWVKTFHSENDFLELIKMTMPNKNTIDCLRYLNRMNINHLTLFPDLAGASQFCNKELEIKNY